ncbi:MAG: DUF302 domain-containing protein [Rhodobacteraceae bacterium]|nr:DUF302 domain-containing protein [Paracoccaceae bacterium]
MTRPALLAALFALLAAPALADPPTVVTITGTFDDATFELQNAITNAGLVIDSVSHTGDMLERTKTAVGATRTIFTHADVFSFCSAKVSREVMEADPMNVQFCPYHIFVAEQPEAPGRILIGHQVYTGPAMDKVNALLDGIIKDALSSN